MFYKIIGIAQSTSDPDSSRVINKVQSFQVMPSLADMEYLLLLGEQWAIEPTVSELPVDQVMKVMGQPTLPGLD
jgi:hypothetical protein